MHHYKKKKMKQYNIEEQLQRKLKEREITPSAEAWGRIAYNRQQQKKKKSLLGWYWAVAAILIISLGGLLATALKNSDTIEIRQQKVVEQQAKPKVTAPQPENILQQEIRNEIVLQHKKTEINRTAQPEIAPPPRPKLEPVNTLPDAEIAKANEVALALHQLAVANGTVSENEVDSLLHKAQREIAMERLQNKKRPTDDTALLNEVEKEMENSFRDKTLNIFKLKFKTIKIAFKDKQ